MTQNIAVIAANGKSGQLIVREAVDRGLDVTAVVRGENKTVAQHAIIKDLFDLTAADLAGFDVVVDAFGAWTPEIFPQHSTSLKHLADVLSGADARLIVVGGAGSLYVNPEHTVQLSQTDGFPEAFLPLATAMGGNKQHPEIKTISGCLCVWARPQPSWRLRPAAAWVFGLSRARRATSVATSAACRGGASRHCLGRAALKPFASTLSS